ncbi:MAG: hypothetical protein K0S47_2477 [Herbinix sp.]|jgi:ABC-2 type transport system permease protein|nr:hypothetical protein [Herbinix sp.]
MNDLMKNDDKDKSFFGKIKASFSGRKFKSGAYVTMVSLITVVIVLVINLFVTKLDLKLDVSKEGMYTLTDETKELAKTIKDDITIYYLVQAGNESDIFKKIVEKYETLSSNIKVESKDPVLYPNFASEFVEEEVTENSIIVVNNTNGRAKYVDNSDMIISEMDYNTYQSYTSAIDVEGQISAALQYVTDTNLPMMYILGGHGEIELGDTVTKALEKQNVTTKALNTMTEGKIPEDCAVLLINGPQYDLTEDEVTLIKDYMAAGGDVIITLDYTAEKLANFNSLLEYNGIDVLEGIVFEAEAGYYMANYANYLAPKLESHELTSDIKSDKKYVIAPGASGLAILDNTRSSLTVTPLLTTSDKAYSKINTNPSTASKEEGDIEGPFYIGAIATDTYDNVTSNMVVYSSAYLLDEGMTSISSAGNLDLFLNTVNYLSGKESTLSIRTRSVQQEQLSVTAGSFYLWGALLVVILPACIIVVGIVVVVRRRKR